MHFLGFLFDQIQETWDFNAHCQLSVLISLYSPLYPHPMVQCQNSLHKLHHNIVHTHSLFISPISKVSFWCLKDGVSMTDETKSVYKMLGGAEEVRWTWHETCLWFWCLTFLVTHYLWCLTTACYKIQYNEALASTRNIWTGNTSNIQSTISDHSKVRTQCNRNIIWYVAAASVTRWCA